MNYSETTQFNQPPDLTILVPTYKRARMLHNCLISIAGQSLISRVKEVIVSENSDDDQSRSVVNAFAEQLPIRYIQQRGDWPARQHRIWLAHQVETKFVAIIADDDMWSRYHLEEGMRSFTQHPTIHAYFGQTIVVQDETCQPFATFSGSFLQVPSHADSELVDFRIWDRKETAINCLANTPLNIWAVVALADAHRFAVNTSAGDPDFGKYPSNDRLYIWRLSLHGDIAIGRNISLFYRRHSGQDIYSQLTHHTQEFYNSDLKISNEIARQAGELGINACQEWRERYEFAINYGLPLESINPGNPLIKNWLLNEQVNDQEKYNHPIEQGLGAVAKKYIYLFSPPIIFSFLRKLKTRQRKS